MIDLTTAILYYLLIHGVSTIGAIIVFLIRNENRLTKLETSLNGLKTSHDVLTNHGTIGHKK
jgi:NADH:ubiquinone oxidoreductase subunit 2 (subunit N)